MTVVTVWMTLQIVLLSMGMLVSGYLWGYEMGRKKRP